MSDVNNFITDLLDEFPERNAVGVWINPGRHVYYKNADGYEWLYDKGIVDKDELIEDLAALGITEHAVIYYLNYTTATGEKLILRALTATSMGEVVSGQFALITEPTAALLASLKTENPVLESEHHQMPAF